MDPNQQPLPPSQPAGPQATPPSGDFNANQYDFIMNPGQKPKRSLLPGGKQKWIILAAGGLIVVMVVMILGTLLFGGGGGNSSSDQLLKVVKQQREIIRVSENGMNKAGGTEAKKLAGTTKLVVTTDNADLLSYLQRQKVKVDSKQLASTPSEKSAQAKTDNELETAELNGRFDEVFLRIMTSLLEEYQKALASAHNTSENKNTKELLTKQSDNVPLLLDKKETEN